MPEPLQQHYTNLAGGIDESVSDLLRRPERAKSIFDWHFNEQGSLVKRRGPKRIITHPVGFTKIADMEPGESWTNGGAPVADTVHFKEGTQSIAIKNVAPLTTRFMTLILNPALNLGDNTQQYIEFWAYIWDDSDTKAADLGLIQLFLFDGSSKFLFAELSINGIVSTGRVVPGWNLIRWKKSIFGKTGTPRWTNIDKVQFGINGFSGNSGGLVKVSFDMLIQNPAKSVRGIWDHKGSIIIATDSGAGVIPQKTEIWKNSGTLSWTQLKSGLGDSWDYDAETFKGRLHIVNGIDPNMKYDGDTITDMGLLKPSLAPVLVEGAAGVLSGTYEYNYSWFSSTTGHETDLATLNTSITVTDKKVDLSVIAAATHPDYDKKRVYRTKSGFGTLQRLIEISNAQTALTDNTLDDQLGADARFDNGVPPISGSIETFDNRLWFGKQKEPDDELINFGKVQVAQSVDLANDFIHLISGQGHPNIGLKTAQGGLFAFTKKKAVGIFPTGSSATPYIPRDLSPNAGIHSNRAIGVFEDEIIAFGGKTIFKSIEGAFTNKFARRVRDFLASSHINYSVADKSLIYVIPALNQVRLSLILSGEIIHTRVLIYDYFNDAFTIFRRNVSASGIVNWQGEDRVMVGNEFGIISEEDAAEDDDGLSIDAAFDWTWLDQGFPNRPKYYRFAYLYFTGTGTWDVDIKYFLDYDTSTSFSETKTLSPGGMVWGTWVWGTGKWGNKDSDMLVIPINQLARSIKFNIDAKGSRKQVTFQGMTLSYSLKKTRPWE